jgi:hypothetical protein
MRYQIVTEKNINVKDNIFRYVFILYLTGYEMVLVTKSDSVEGRRLLEMWSDNFKLKLKLNAFLCTVHTILLTFFNIKKYEFDSKI